jgi:hypothetical protein
MNVHPGLDYSLFLMVFISTGMQLSTGTRTLNLSASKCVRYYSMIGNLHK